MFKRIFILLCVMFAVALPSHAIFGLEKMFKGLIHAELSAVKNDIQGDVNGVRGDINGVKGDLIGKLDKLIDMQVKV